MNKLVIRNSTISALLIILLVIVLLWSDRSPYGKNQSYFASLPKKEITEIEISDSDKKIVLTKSDDEWKLNGTKETRRSEVLFLLRILKEMQIKSPVSPELFENEITSNGIQAVKVRVFEGRRLLNSFLVYPVPSNDYGNIMKKKHRTKPFIVYIPGYEGDIGAQFNTDEFFWQPFSIFNLLPSEISSVTLQNVSDPASSFTINRKNGIFSLVDSLSCANGWDTARVKRYISYFTRVPFENRAYDLTAESRKEIIEREPLYKIIVEKTEGNNITLILWARYNLETGVSDSDRLWGKTGESDELFIVRYFDIDPLLKKVTYFCKE